MEFTRKHWDFHGQFVSFREGSSKLTTHMPPTRTFLDGCQREKSGFANKLSFEHHCFQHDSSQNMAWFNPENYQFYHLKKCALWRLFMSLKHGCLKVEISETFPYAPYSKRSIWIWNHHYIILHIYIYIFFFWSSTWTFQFAWNHSIHIFSL